MKWADRRRFMSEARAELARLIWDVEHGEEEAGTIWCSGCQKYHPRFRRRSVDQASRELVP